MKRSKQLPQLKSKADSVTKDWIRKPSDDVAVNVHGCYFDLDEANRVRDFLRNYCRHSKGDKVGEPFELLDWQWYNFVGPVFGWKLPDGTRRIRDVQSFMPKKNGKSTLCAGLAIYLMSGDNEPASEVYLAASDREQASIVYNECRLMIESSEELNAAFDIRESKKAIYFPDNNSLIRAISREARRNEGYNIHGLVFDELHTQQNRLLWAALKYGGAARKQPLKISISTAGELDETLLWWEIFQNAISLEEGKHIDISTWPCVYYIKDNEDWKDEKVWARVNPSWDYTINKYDFKNEFAKALKGGANESEFLRYRLNRATKHESAWIQNHYWTGCTFKNEEDLSLEECPLIVAGLDLADSFDLNAFAILAREPVKVESKVINGKIALPKIKTEQPKNVKHILKPYFWAPSEAGMSTNKQNRERYVQWFENGLLRQIKGPIAKQNLIGDDIVGILKGYRDEGIEVDEICMDRFQATNFGYELQAKLINARLRTKLRLVGYNYVSMNEPTKLLEELIHSSLLIHDDNPIVNWMFSNVQVTIDSNGNRKLDKSNVKGKIDIFAAMCLALRGYMDIAQTRKSSKYNNSEHKLQTKQFYGVV